MKLKRYHKKKISNYLALTLLIIFLSWGVTFYVINYFSVRADKILLPMAESKARSVVATILNNSTKDIEIENNLIILNKDDKDEIKMVTYNSNEVIKLINEITYIIQDNLLMYQDDSFFVLAEIPFGVIFDNSMMANIGPKIKIKLSFIGDVVTYIETEVKPYGLNNAYVEMRLLLVVRGKIVLPFASKEIEISNNVPISMNIVQGTVPQAYISSFK